MMKASAVTPKVLLVEPATTIAPPQSIEASAVMEAGAASEAAAAGAEPAQGSLHLLHPRHLFFCFLRQ